MASIDQLLKTNARPEIAFTLSSRTDDIHQRHLVAGCEPIIIGRASKHEGRGVQAKPDNAAFNCPVVSREHAIIDTEWNETTQEHDVVIKDKASLHGTFINGQKITPNAPYSLRDGDVIELGTNVARDKDLYHGVTVVFKLDDNNLDEDAVHSGIQRGYSVPSDSEAEHESEYDYGLYDDEYRVEEPTSVDTSPLSKQNLDAREKQDHTEMLHGSQHEPIDLEEFHSGSLRQVYDFTEETALRAPVSKSVVRAPAYVWQSTNDLKLKTNQFSQAAMQHASSLLATSTLPLKSTSSPAATGRVPWITVGTNAVSTSSQSDPQPGLVGIVEVEQQLPVSLQDPDSSQYDIDVSADDAHSDGSVELGEESFAYETRTPKSRTDSAKVINKFLPMDENLKLPPINSLSWRSAVGLSTYMPLHTATAVGEEVDEQHDSVNPGQSMDPAAAVNDSVVTGSDHPPDHETESTFRATTNEAVANLASPSRTKTPVPMSSSEVTSRTAQSGIANAALGKKRKHEQVLGRDVEDMLAGSSLRPYARPVKKARTHKSTTQASVLHDMRKYALGAALGAAGTFTLLASPLGGRLVDWASTL